MEIFISSRQKHFEIILFQEKDIAMPFEIFRRHNNLEIIAEEEANYIDGCYNAPL